MLYFVQTLFQIWIVFELSSCGTCHQMLPKTYCSASFQKHLKLNWMLTDMEITKGGNCLFRACLVLTMLVSFCECPLFSHFHFWVQVKWSSLRIHHARIDIFTMSFKFWSVLSDDYLKWNLWSTFEKLLMCTCYSTKNQILLFCTNVTWVICWAEPRDWQYRHLPRLPSSWEHLFSIWDSSTF